MLVIHNITRLMGKRKKILIIFIILSLCNILISFCDVKDRKNTQVNNLSMRSSDAGYAWKAELKVENGSYVSTIYIVTEQDGEDSTYEICDKYGYKIKQGKLEAGSNTLNVKQKLNKDDFLTLKTSMRVSEVECTVIPLKKVPMVCHVLIELLIILSLFLVYNGKRVKAEKIINLFCNMSSPKKIEFLLWFILFLVPFASIMYGDTKAFVHYGVNFWRSVTEGGGIRYFYEFSNAMLDNYKANNIGGAYDVIYDFPVYILFGIWNFPLWLTLRFAGIEETSCFWTMLYSKSIYLVAIGITAYLIYKVCRNIDVKKEHAKWAAFLFVSSMTVFTEIGIAGQLDVIGMPFSLLGIYYFQKKDKWKFIAFFSLAVSFKQFPLFVFIPLLFLIEKNVIKIVIDFCAVMAVTVLSGLPFPKNTVAMQVKEQVRNRFMESFLGVKAPLFNSAIPIIVLLIGGICVFCYCKTLKDKDELQQYSVFIPTLIMFVLFVGFDSNPYWFIHLAPYMAILMVYNSEQFNRIALFEIVGMICLTLYQYGQNYWIYDSEWARGMLLDQIFDAPTQLISMELLAGYTRMTEYAFVFFAGYILCIIACLSLSLPSKMKQKEEVMIRPIAILRLLINAGMAMIPVGLYFISRYI
mgnify:CR=1 FL=1